jgi:hypothetical protein
VVYPADTVLVPPNLNTISVQWTPYGAPFTRFSVDFSSPPNPDWHIVSACRNQTIDAQSGNPSGGCEVVVDPVSWSKLVGANRGQSPVTITVRGTTDGICASTSTNSVHLSFAEEDVLGTYYYWKSKASSGVGGQIWAKTFGDLNTSERDVTSAVVPGASCNGCHVVSRDGSRMSVYSDDGDTDDEYGDIGGSLLDMTTLPDATEFAGGVSGSPPSFGQPPGFGTFHPLSSYYLASNGVPLTAAGAPGAASTSSGYASPVPANGFALWDGQTGAWVGGVTVGPAGTRPTMPDWSIDGTSIVYVQPSAIAQSYQDGGAPRDDDDHVFGGSLYTVPYTGNAVFGAPSLLLPSGGENNYYPSYSPDVPMSFVLFDRAPLDTSVASLTGCISGLCPNDSFSNPAARLMLVANAAGATPIDLESANGSPRLAPTRLSNSYPRWAPFVQMYRGQKLLWITFSSTRDYGLRLLNQKTNMHPCYPANGYETPGPASGNAFGPQCQQPQLWMAPINLSVAQGNTDPSRVAFWIPYQDTTTHNHTAQWTTEQVPPPTTDGGGCACALLDRPCGPPNRGCGCCVGQGVCAGTGLCAIPAP